MVSRGHWVRSCKTNTAAGAGEATCEMEARSKDTVKTQEARSTSLILCCIRQNKCAKKPRLLKWSLLSFHAATAGQ